MQRQWLNWKNRILYATNKFKYDAQKRAEVIWYGSKNVGSAHANVAVPFMITMQMRTQLTQRGFPSNVIASLTPQDVHTILQANTLFEEYQAQAKADATSESPKDVETPTDTTEPTESPVLSSSSSALAIVEESPGADTEAKEAHEKPLQ
ncbi:unnamed protein product [Aphanomyces euteiches]|uniref:Uncharacterized protein n=1 Tax=Aphanomyces euteiches TaxID=100861 RepID=A0A6G0XUT2_9STRA|nr:hypothetical protein Ae201684_000784 [Aphanomyces euteiches]KAH9099445.1 hypothetical protein Ae201684P_018460 [Aphanomyces euteiches]KAH9153541.1 hypothetical protein AeRB84_004231 [Aphanomyces euteiches]KAH9163020.1 hypothetical protein LEN26_000683 [Aphanomyces euteiches]